MKSYFVTFFLYALSAIAATEETSLPSASLRQSTTGFYPLWENTAYVEHHGDLHFGLFSGHVGLLNQIQLGVSPVNFLYRSPNIFIKSHIFGSENFTLASQVGFYYLLEGAGRSTASPNYASRLDNPDFTVTLLPISLIGTYTFRDIVSLHQTFTTLGEFSNGGIRDEAYFAYSLVTEFLPLQRHALLLHWTDIGLWKHEMTMLGASYRYRNTWLELKAGYFYRFREVGNQSGPLITFGLLL